MTKKNGHWEFKLGILHGHENDKINKLKEGDGVEVLKGGVEIRPKGSFSRQGEALCSLEPTANNTRGYNASLDWTDG